jgi:hypothetical protein
MKKLTIAGFAVALFLIVGVRAAEDLPKMPPPQKEHEWLKQLGGEWDAEAQLFMEQDKPPTTSKGTDSVRMIGGFWSVAETKASVMDMPFTGIMTLGYDPEKKKYIGTWVDSMGSRLWTYTGTLDSSGKKLTLETEGPCPMQGGRMSKFKEIMEIQDTDHRTFTSTVQFEDGKWVTMMKVSYQRKK